MIERTYTLTWAVSPLAKPTTFVSDDFDEIQDEYARIIAEGLTEPELMNITEE